MITMKSESVVGLVRKNNEDMVITKHYSDLDLAVVCDGLGGCNAGEVASALAISMFVNQFDSRPHDDIPDLINRGVDLANDAVFQAGKTNVDFKGMGCTLTGVAFKNDVAYVFNIGDSRVYRLRGRVLEQITEDDNEVTLALKRPDLYEKEVPGFGLTKTIGIWLGVEATIQAIKLHNNDRFVICSDGLYNMVSDEKIEAILMVSGVDRAVEDLVKIAMQEGGVDNCTLVVAKFDTPPAIATKPTTTTKPTLFKNEVLNQIATGVTSVVSGVGNVIKGKSNEEKALIRQSLGEVSTMTEEEKDEAIEELNKELNLPEPKRYEVTKTGQIVDTGTGEIFDSQGCYDSD